MIKCKYSSTQLIRITSVVRQWKCTDIIQTLSSFHFLSRYNFLHSHGFSKAQSKHLHRCWRLVLMTPLIIWTLRKVVRWHGLTSDPSGAYLNVFVWSANSRTVLVINPSRNRYVIKLPSCSFITVLHHKCKKGYFTDHWNKQIMWWNCKFTNNDSNAILCFMNVWVSKSMDIIISTSGGSV